MALSAFDDKHSPPTKTALKSTLGRANVLWTRLSTDLQTTHGPLVEEWSFAGKAYGWSMRLKRQKRAIVYMTPGRGEFLASFALGEKACAAAHAEGLHPDALALIDNAPRYAEGRGVRIPVRSTRDVAIVEALAAIKVAH